MPDKDKEMKGITAKALPYKTNGAGNELSAHTRATELRRTGEKSHVAKARCNDLSEQIKAAENRMA